MPAVSAPRDGSEDGLAEIANRPCEYPGVIGPRRHDERPFDTNHQVFGA